MFSWPVWSKSLATIPGIEQRFLSPSRVVILALDHGGIRFNTVFPSVYTRLLGGPFPSGLPIKTVYKFFMLLAAEWAPGP